MTLAQWCPLLTQLHARPGEATEDGPSTWSPVFTGDPALARPRSSHGSRLEVSQRMTDLSLGLNQPPFQTCGQGAGGETQETAPIPIGSNSNFPLEKLPLSRALSLERLAPEPLPPVTLPATSGTSHQKSMQAVPQNWRAPPSYSRQGLTTGASRDTLGKVLTIREKLPFNSHS